MKVQANRPIGLRLAKTDSKGVVYPEAVRGGRGASRATARIASAHQAAVHDKFSRQNNNPMCWVHDRPPDD